MRRPEKKQEVVPGSSWRDEAAKFLAEVTSVGEKNKGMLKQAMALYGNDAVFGTRRSNYAHLLALPPMCCFSIRWS